MDRTLRQAERDGDGEALLRARIATGELSREQVQLAASLGHPDAALLFPAVVTADWSSTSSVALALAQAAELLGETLPARVAADWAEHVLHVWEAVYPDDNLPREAIAAARAFARCPCPDHSVLAQEACDAADAHPPDGPAEAALTAAACAAVAGGGYPLGTPSQRRGAAEHAALTAEHAARAAGDSQAAEREWQRLRLAAYALDPVAPPR